MPQLLPFDGTSISTDEMFPRSVCFSVPDAELPACPRRQAEQRAARRELQNDWLRLQAQMRTLSLLGNATSPARVASARRDTRGGSLSPTEFARGVSRLQDALQHVADMSHSVQSAQRMCVLQLHQMDAQTKVPSLPSFTDFFYFHLFCKKVIIDIDLFTKKCPYNYLYCRWLNSRAMLQALRQQRRLEEQEYFVPEGQHEMIASEANRSRQLQLQ